MDYCPDSWDTGANRLREMIRLAGSCLKVLPGQVRNAFIRGLVKLLDKSVCRGVSFQDLTDIRSAIGAREEVLTGGWNWAVSRS